MTDVMTLPRSRPLVRADLAETPDDGHRYELLDGVLLVSPAPRPVHQRAVLRLATALVSTMPEELEVLVAPLDVVLAEDTVLQPDIVVARRSELTDAGLPAAPVLAVEVLSPSTRRVDLLLKRDRLEAAGCPAYWVVDPDEPSLRAWELRESAYVEVGRAVGDETLDLRMPGAISVTPSALVS